MDLFVHSNSTLSSKSIKLLTCASKVFPVTVKSPFTVKLVNDIQTGKTIFNKETWEYLVSNEFEIVSSEVKEGILYDNQSKWLEIVAKK